MGILITKALNDDHKNNIKDDDMTNTKHTPGPWRVTENKKFGWLDVSHNQWCEKGETSTVVRVEDFQPSPQKEANARLIAAAPDLLEALEYVIQWRDNPGIWDAFTARDKARAAIAKARAA